MKLANELMGVKGDGCHEAKPIIHPERSAVVDKTKIFSWGSSAISKIAAESNKTWARG
ncbi:MAG: hypothetical protein IPN53_07185 [Comamonadaceae bacterium]|nr:hypothetical protein [Comamonadaceae bacterium]